MNQDYWEARRDANGNPALWPMDDQTHHFAAFFFMGSGPFGLGDANIVLARELKSSGDYPGPPSPSAPNPGDYYLGILAADIGNAYRQHPGYFGTEIDNLLKQPWQQAFSTTGRGVNLP
jgi:hypothetical protein